MATVIDVALSHLGLPALCPAIPMVRSERTSVERGVQRTGDDAMRILMPIALAAALVVTALPVAAQQGQGQGQGMGPGMHKRFQEMEQMRGQMQGSQGQGQRQQLRQQHRLMMQEQMRDLDGMPRPGPQATPEDRLRIMEERHAVMERMMREMIETPPVDE